MITKLNLTDKTIKSYAIRKLTNREAFRLMGVDDETIDTMQAEVDGKLVVSSSQQYRQAGNSIVVQCLERIMENLFWPVIHKEEKVIECDDGIHADVTIAVADDGQMSFF